jgi:hypothetical protein
MRLVLLVDSSLTDQKVALGLSEIVAERRVPVSITVDNGSEFQTKAMDVWGISITAFNWTLSVQVCLPRTDTSSRSMTDVMGV